MWIKSTAKTLLWYQLLEKIVVTIMRIFAAQYDSTSMETFIKICKHTLLHIATFLPVFLLLFALHRHAFWMDQRNERALCLCWCAKLPKWTSNWLAFILSEETCLLPRDTFQRTANRPAATRNRRLPITSTAKRTGVHLLCACNR